MANEVLLKQGTVLKFGKGPATDVEFDFKANQNRQSDTCDFGTDIDTWWTVQLKTEFIAAPDAGKVVEIYIAWSDNGTKWPGGVTGNDGTYRLGENPDDWIRQLQYIGSLVCTNDTGPQLQIVGGFYPKARYGSLVKMNKTNQAHSVDLPDNVIFLIPITHEVQ